METTEKVYTREQLMKYAELQYTLDKGPYEVVESLKSQGVNEPLAQQAADESHELFCGKMRRKAGGKIALGAIVFLIGLVVTFSGVGVVAYGAVIVGIIWLVQGIKMYTEY